MNKKFLSSAAGIMALAVSATVNAQTVIIDLFDDAQSVTDASCASAPLACTGSDGAEGSQLMGTNIIGDYRDITVDLTQSSSPAALNVTAQAVAGFFSISQDNTAGAEVTVQWDGEDSASVGGTNTLDPTGLGGVNLSAGSQFSFTVLSADLGFTAVISVFTDADNFSEVTIIGAPVAAPTTFSVVFAAFLDCTFAACGGGGANQPVDFANVGAIQLLINPNGGAVDIDLSIDNILVPVPEPAVIALLSIGLLGMGASARRRKTALQV